MEFAFKWNLLWLEGTSIYLVKGFFFINNTFKNH